MDNFSLKLLAKLYGMLAFGERKFFSLFPFLVKHPKAKVISIGNLSVGGTGKTPILFEMVQEIRESRKVAVLSRGYRSPWERSFYLLRGRGSHPRALTDEALLFNRKFPEIPLLLGKNRAHSAGMAERLFSPEVLFLDDGFQYRRIRKDCDFVLWDATLMPQDSRLLPCGRLREPLRRLRAATAVFMTRCESVSTNNKKLVLEQLSMIAPDAPIIEVKTQPCGWISSSGGVLPCEKGPERVLAFAAIASPESFMKMLHGLGKRVVATAWFRDHHLFSSNELIGLGEKAAEANATLVCTEKDLVKIPDHIVRKQNIFALTIRMVPASGMTFQDQLSEFGISL